MTIRRGRRRKNLLDDLKDRRVYSNLKGVALNRTMWRNRYGYDLSSDRLLKKKANVLQGYYNTKYKNTLD